MAVKDTCLCNTYHVFQILFQNLIFENKAIISLRQLQNG
jgi:hypothetical protein